MTYTLDDYGYGYFQIDATTGEITVAAGAVLDYEDTNYFQMEVTATDATGETSQAYYNVQLNDLVLSFNNQSATFYIDENSGADTPVGTVLTTSASGGVTYSLDDYGYGYFQIDSTTGEITVAAGAVLDYEDVFYFQMEVTATDATGETSQATYYVALNDQVLSFNNPGTTFSIDENSAADTPVGTVVTTSMAGGENYTLDDYGYGYFQIDGTTGEITVAAGAALDFEDTNFFQMEVTATDASGETSLAYYYVELNNVDPEAINGTEGDDTLTDVSGDEVINGLGGADDIHSANGADQVNGGDGDDSIQTDGDGATVHGDAGYDTIYLVGAGSTGYADEDGAQIFSYADGNVLVGGDADDILAVSDYYSNGPSNNVLQGGGGSDSLQIGGGSNNVVEGGAGVDYLFLLGGSASEAYGGDEGDGITVNSAADIAVIDGEGGDDYLYTQDNDSFDLSLVGSLNSLENAVIAEGSTLILTADDVLEMMANTDTGYSDFYVFDGGAVGNGMVELAGGGFTLFDDTGTYAYYDVGGGYGIAIEQSLAINVV
ncbi:MAG TPA: cadherin repeat domain-containing protein [Solimonas sp.]|nr:cadherin repeat domain-containing protein [Solimonas sp.]